MTNDDALPAHTDHPLRHFDRTCPACAALAARPNPLCGLSTDGVNVQGDAQSIRRVKEWCHAAGTVPELRERLVRAERALTARAEPVAYDCNWPHCDCDPSSVDSPPCRAEHANERAAQPALPQDAHGYAQRLATSLWERHYKTDAPDWEPLPDLMGVLTQIDNMLTGLQRAAPK